MDGVEVVLGVLGERVGFADQSTHPRPQRAEPAFDVVGFALLFAARTVGVLWERGGVSIPVITAGGAVPVALGQRGPQVTGALQAPVTKGPAHDLAGASAQRHPQPERLRLAAHETPEFVQFEHVTVLAGQERVHERRELVRFFPPAKPSRFGSTPRKFAGCRVSSCGPDRQRAPGL